MFLGRQYNDSNDSKKHKLNFSVVTEIYSGLEWIILVVYTSKMVQTDEKVYDSKSLIRLVKKGNTNYSFYNPFHQVLSNNCAGEGLFNLSILGNLRGLECTKVTEGYKFW